MPARLQLRRFGLGRQARQAALVGMLALALPLHLALVAGHHHDAGAAAGCAHCAAGAPAGDLSPPTSTPELAVATVSGPPPTARPLAPATAPPSARGPPA